MKPSLNECLCPVCMEILIEPVTMPCHHELCLPCFQHHVQEVNFYCPICRHRISTWARSAVNSNTLVDVKRWAEIKKFFPNEVNNRLSGKTDSGRINSPPSAFQVLRSLSEPGEIRREYEEERRKFQEQLNRQRQEEEEASLRLIERLTAADGEEVENENGNITADEDELHNRHRPLTRNALNNRTNRAQSVPQNVDPDNNRYNLRH